MSETLTLIYRAETPNNQLQCCTQVCLVLNCLQILWDKKVPKPVLKLVLAAAQPVPGPISYNENKICFIEKLVDITGSEIHGERRLYVAAGTSFTFLGMCTHAHHFGCAFVHIRWK